MDQQISTAESFIVAVDTGNKQIKTQNHIFTAGVVSHDSYPPFGKDAILYNGKFYTLSGQRIPYMRDKSHDQHPLRADRLFGDNPPNGRAGPDGGCSGSEIFTKK